MQNERIKDQLKTMVYDAINSYLNKVDVTDYIFDLDIEDRIRDRMEDYIVSNLEDALDEVIDEIFDDM